MKLRRKKTPSNCFSINLKYYLTILAVNRAMKNELKAYFFPRHKLTEIHGTMPLFLLAVKSPFFLFSSPVLEDTRIALMS